MPNKFQRRSPVPATPVRRRSAPASVASGSNSHAIDLMNRRNRGTPGGGSTEAGGSWLDSLGDLYGGGKFGTSVGTFTDLAGPKKTGG
ncbi:MAG: hypothetical protein R3F61_21040 [Myxococcota bacterium]